MSSHELRKNELGGTKFGSPPICRLLSDLRISHFHGKLVSENLILANTWVIFIVKSII